MKEALELVKFELGPNAIILNAKDNSRKYGLVGEGSVEITAAVPELELQKKAFTESRLPNDKRELLRKSSAKIQKGVISRVVSQYQTEVARSKENSAEKENAGRTVTRYRGDEFLASKNSASNSQELSGNKTIARPAFPVRYIDIHDEEEFTFGQTVISPMTSATERIKGAAQKAWDAMHAEFQRPQEIIPQENVQHEGKEQNMDILLKEITDLKKVIEGFKSVPQNFMSNYPGSEYGLPHDVSFMFEKLKKAGFLEEYIVEILALAKDTLDPIKLKKPSLVEGFVAHFILNNIRIFDPKDNKKLHVFVGGSGHGKTSSLVKFASHLVIRERKKVLIVSTDSLKVGASDQLKIFAQILNVPFLLIRSPEDWGLVQARWNDFDAILTDTPGFGLKWNSELMSIKQLLPPENFDPQVHLVLSATSKDQDAFEITKRFIPLKFQDVIFTALDESTQHGLLYNFQKHFGKPLHSFGIGPNIPEDYERASRERVLDLIFQISKNPLKVA